MRSKTPRIEIYKYDRIFEQTLIRLKTTSDVSDEDKTCIGQLVDHLLAKNVSKQRAVKYVNHLIVVARIAGQPLGRLDNKGMETVF